MLENDVFLTGTQPTSSEYFKVIQGDLRCSNVAYPQLGFHTIIVGKF